MATITTSGIDPMMENLKKFGKEMYAVQDDMLDEGAKVLTEEWKSGIEAAGHVDTGEMRDSVGVAKQTIRSGLREVYPQGVQKKGKSRVRNAEKAYVLHYGTSKIDGDRFVDKIEDAAEPKVAAAMQDILNKHLKMKGLI